jgi:hypothetical protein
MVLTRAYNVHGHQTSHQRITTNENIRVPVTAEIPEFTEYLVASLDGRTTENLIS